MKITKIAGVVFFLVLFVSANVAFAGSTDTSFQQAVAEYQHSPSKEGADKVIKLAAGMDKLPPVPEEARKHFIKGSALFKEAKTPQDFSQVLDEFTQAVHLAPWWPEARYNRALAFESAGNYPSAINGFRHYLLFKLSDTEARAVQDKIYVLEAKQEKKAKESSPEAVVAQNTTEDWIKKLDGVRYIYDASSPAQFIDIKDGMLIRSKGDSAEFGPGRELGRSQIHSHIVDLGQMYSFKISDDGQSIEEDHPGDQYNPPFIFHRSG